MTSKIPLSMPKSFESERLVLRRYHEEDASWFFPMSQRNRNHLARYESGNVVMSLTDLEHTRRTLLELERYWDDEQCLFVGAFLRASGEFAAQVYVGPFRADPPEYIIGYFADVDQEGHGYVTEAVQAVIAQIFDRLDAHRVRIHCDTTNLRSRAVAERCGFAREGRIRQDHRNPDGSLSDTLVYGLLRTEFATRE